jgi:hypothetical protein
MFYPLDLGDNDVDVTQEPLRIVIVYDIHINPLVTTRKKRCVILIGLNTATDRCEYKCPRVDGFQVASWHLQDDRICCRHHSHNFGAAFYASASFILLRLV